MTSTEVLHLTPTQRGELQAYLRKRNLPASVAQRMRIVLPLDESTSYRDIEEKLGTPASTISRWKQRYQEDGVLESGDHPSRPATAEINARVTGASFATDPTSAAGLVPRIGPCVRWRR